MNLFNMTHSAITTFSDQGGTVFSVKMLETLFENGVPTDIAFPVGCLYDLPGKPLWHAFLLHLPYGFLPCMWEAIELWLKKGANARVSLRFRRYGGSSSMSSTWALDARDGSRVIQESDLLAFGTSMSFTWELDVLYQALDRQRGYQQYPEELDLELRDLVTLLHPRNEREILNLIDAQVANESRRRDEIRVDTASNNKLSAPPESSGISGPKDDSPPMQIAEADRNTTQPSPLAEADEKSNTRLQQTWTRNLVWIYLRTCNLHSQQGLYHS
jgi:hypothetical protein